MSFRNIKLHGAMCADTRFGQFFVKLQEIKVNDGETAEDLIVRYFMSKFQYDIEFAAKRELFDRVRKADSSDARNVDCAFADILRYAIRSRETELTVTGEQLYQLFNAEQNGYALTEAFFDNLYYEWDFSRFSDSETLSETSETSESLTSDDSWGSSELDEKTPNCRLPFAAFGYLTILSASTTAGAMLGSGVGGIGMVPGALLGFVAGLFLCGLVGIARMCMKAKETYSGKLFDRTNSDLSCYKPLPKSSQFHLKAC